MAEETLVCEPEASKVVDFELAPASLSVIDRNGVELLVPNRTARRKCTVNEIIEAIGGEDTPSDDFRAQSTYGDNSRLARKMGVSLRTDYAWRKQYPLVDAAMREEAERNKDWVENVVGRDDSRDSRLRCSVHFCLSWPDLMGLAGSDKAD